MRKAKYLVLPIVILSVLSIMIFNITKNTEKTIATNSIPITSHVVVIDAGHGKPDEGAVGMYGTTEEAINLKISLKLQKLIEQSGGKVYLTRSDENGIYSQDSVNIKQKKASDIKNRVNIGSQEDVDVFVSIHLNKYPESIYKGWQTFYQESSEDSKNLATFVQNGISNTIDIENNRVPLPIKNIYIMDHMTKPTITVECGFLSNEDEVKRLGDDEYQNKLAWGIYIGIQDYFQSKK